MSTIKMETLSSIHIGSSNQLQQNSDFVIEGDRIGIIDERKILELIGISNMEKWVQCIEKNESTKSYLKRYAPTAILADYSKRILDCYAGEINKTDTLKECIHDGNSIPYLPGSSIKGAIRTAILASLTSKIPSIETKVFNKKGFVSASEVEKQLFGVDPNSDLFRFIHVGDAYFKKGSEIALKMVNLNIRKRNDYWDTSKPQLLEAIAAEEESNFKLKIDISHYSIAKNKQNSLPVFYEELNSIPNLFQTINAHSRKLIYDELQFWKEYVGETNVVTYLEQMQGIMESIDECEPGKSCVLRVGHASGWRFITGAWTETLTNFQTTIVPKCRPRNDKYTEYAFPKTRRVDDECYLLGFVKLTAV